MTQFENHYGHPFQERCPHCGSFNLEEIPSVNLIRKFGCKDCRWTFGVKGYGDNAIVKGVFYHTQEEWNEIQEKALITCINDVIIKHGGKPLRKK